MPNYSILVDTRDRLAPQVTYVPQENIEVIVNTQVSEECMALTADAVWFRFWFRDQQSHYRRPM